MAEADDFFVKFPRIDDDAIADDRRFACIENTRRNQMQGIASSSDND